MAVTVSRLGQANGSDSATALFKTFQGEVITAFERNSTVIDKHFIQNIDKGKSATFPCIGRSSGASYLTPGDDVTGTIINTNEKEILVDGLLYDAKWVSDIDEMMNNYDVRQKYSKSMGESLSTFFDKNVYQEIILGARSNAIVTGLENGLVITDANLASTTASTKFAAWKDAIIKIGNKFDNIYAPQDERYLAVSPEIYNFLMTNAESNGWSWINNDFGGSGQISTGKMGTMLGINIVKTPNVPKTDLTAAAKHAGDFSKTQACAWVSDAVGTVKLKDITPDQSYHHEKFSTLLTASCAMGHGFLIPGGLVELAIV